MIPIDKIIRSKRRTLSLVVERDGTLLVRAPLRAPDRRIRQFVAEHETWIRRKQEQARQTYAPFAPKQYVEGEQFWLLGECHSLRLVERARPALVFNGGFELSRTALPRAATAFERWYRREAGRVLAERAAWYAQLHGFEYGRVRITSARTRWGSCSSKGTLSFPWRLVMAPVPVIDYVVIHELVHLRVKNHSKRFWRQVQALVPDYKQHIEWLDVNGHLLSL